MRVHLAVERCGRAGRRAAGGEGGRGGALIDARGRGRGGTGRRGEGGIAVTPGGEGVQDHRGITTSEEISIEINRRPF